ncbi:type II secretion system protein GspL [Aliikangiella sp. IMCC44359]|uniref:type II secretion system protein GspL n=1 Tax=Aliikangiella sp. IMCC44359 TaxID=3459125 RepID=UPI00403AA5E0
MMGKLTIFWGVKAENSFFWCLDDQNINELSSISTPQLESQEILKADLACMAEIARSRQVELVLSCNDVHFNEVDLPNKAQRHLRKAVPFLIEEHLAEPVDNIFIAIGDRLKTGKIPVRGVALEYIQQITEQFIQAEIKLDSVHVDLDMIRQPEEGFNIVLSNGDVLVTDAEGQRWYCSPDDFSWLSQRVVAEQDSEDDDGLPIATPMTVFCDNQDDYANFEKQLPVGLFAPQVEFVESIEEHISANNQSKFNLLQGEFEPKVESSPLKNMLFKVASIIGVVLAVHLLYQGSQWFWLSSQSEALKQQRIVLWKQAFPGRKTPSNPDKSLRSFMKTIGSGQGEASFLSLLSSSAGLMKDLSQIYPTNISYNSSRNELRMDLFAKDLPVLNKYRDDLKVAGHQVEMSSATQRGDGYSSRLTVKR